MIDPIDLTSLIPAQLAAYPHAVRAVIPDVAEAVRTEIIRLAGEKLTSTADDYVQNVQPVKYHFPTGRMPLTGPTTVASIALTGWLPNAIEHGWSGGDLTDALLSGRNARQGENGPYNVVPFRHGSPTAGGRNFAPMGSQHARLGLMTQEESRRMGRGIHQAAKQLGATTSHASTGTAWGDRLPAGMSPKLKPHHATDIHAGMVRSEKTYRAKTESQFATFRTVSRASEGKWVHPGIEPQGIFADGSDYAGRIAGTLLASALRGAEKA